MCRDQRGRRAGADEPCQLLRRGQLRQFRSRFGGLVCVGVVLRIGGSGQKVQQLRLSVGRVGAFRHSGGLSGFGRGLGGLLLCSQLAGLALHHSHHVRYVRQEE